jgi:hypothetical protein
VHTAACGRLVWQIPYWAEPKWTDPDWWTVVKSSVHSQSSLHNIFQMIEISQTTAALNSKPRQALLVAGKAELVADNGPKFS